MNIFDLFKKKKEEDILFENHSVEFDKYFRLRYVNYHHINGDRMGYMDWKATTYMIPDGMSKEKLFKILSYLIDQIEMKYHLKECSFRSVDLLNKAIKELNIAIIPTSVPKEEEIVDLYNVDGDLDLFKNSKFYSRYFEWYIDGVTKEDIIEEDSIVKRLI